MTYEQYWYGDPLMVRAYYEAEKKRQQRFNNEAWLQGVYTYNALQAALSVSEFFRPKNETPLQYPSKPFDYGEKKEETDVEKEKREEAEAMFAEAYMMNMVLAGKNWKK